MKTRRGKKESMKKLMISHTDLDGYGCFYLAWHFNIYNEYDEIISLDYGYEEDPAIVEKLKTYNIIHIADHSMTQDLIEELLDLDIEITIFDHHDSSEYLCEIDHPNFTIYHDQTRCGTRIYYEEWIKNNCPKLDLTTILDEFVILVDTYDLWKDEEDLWEESVNLNNAFQGIQVWSEANGLLRCKPYFDILDRKLRSDFSHWYWTRKEKETIERANKRIQENYIKATKQISLREDQKGNVFGVFALPSKISLVASMILKSEKFKFLDYIIVANTFGGLNGRMSARSRNGFDCTQLKAFKGHKAAAGGEVSPDLLKDIMENPNYVPLHEDEIEAIETEDSFIIFNAED
jgi:oligoribonuclease NrnB/cAMP/cGMP phosphodiesterase (DHH superfamily)